MPADRIAAHREETARLEAKGWIGPTHSFIGPASMMVRKQCELTGVTKTRIVINYQGLNKLTMSPNHTTPNIAMMMLLLGSAQYFSTLGLEAGFNQV